MKYFRMTYYVMLVKLIPFERKSHLKFLLIPEILLYIFPLMKIRQSLSLTPVSKILKIHLDPYKSTFSGQLIPVLERKLRLIQLWRRFLTIFKMKLLVSYISKVTVVQLRSLVMTLAVIFMMAINKKTRKEQDRSF